MKKIEIPLTSTEKTQLLLSPADSVTSYLMLVFPTLNCCGGCKPLMFKSSLELSVGTWTFQVAVT